MGAYAVKNHVLTLDGKPVAQRPTPNKGGLLKADYLVMHYTAALSAAGAINWLTNPAAKASAHLVIAQDGTVTQLAPLNVVCWHAGKSSWAKRSGCNAFTIGVELANPGPLNKTAAGYATAMEHKPVAAKDVVLAAHKSGGPVRPWAAYPAAQIDAAVGVAQAIVTGLTANTQTNIEFSTGTLIRPQLELGSAFGGLIERGLDAELPYCQRYFQRLPWRGMSVSVPLATRLTLTRSLPAQMRANPTASLVTTSAPAAAAQVAGVDTSAATVAILASYPDKSGISVTINGYAGLTPGQSGFGASAANFLDLDAEI